MFKKLSKAGILSQILVIGILAVVYFITPQVDFPSVADPEPTAPIGVWIYELIYNFPTISRPLVILLTITLSIALNAILVRHDISPRQSVFPAIIALVLMLFSPDPYHLIVTLASLLLLLFSLHSVMDLYGEQYPFNQVMNAGVAISIASMISPPTIVFEVFIWLGFFTFRINTWREWVISLMGLILPYLYLALLYLWNDNLAFAINLYEKLFTNFSFTLQKPRPLEFISLGIFALWIIISAMHYYSDTSEKIISIRKKMWVISHFALAGLAAAFLSGESFLAMLPLVFMPAAAMIAYSVSSSKRSWIHDTLLLLFFAVAILNRLNL